MFRVHHDLIESESSEQLASRIVFLSSVKVHGEETIPGRPLRPGDSMQPQDAYARSKRDAEAALREIASRTGISLCVVRAPLVYGERVRGNLRALARLSDSGWPLPFAAIPNRRSFVHVDDLAGLLVACGESARAHGATYLAAHEHAISTTQVVAGLRRALGRPRRLYAVPPRWLEVGAACIGRRDAALRLTRSLEVDASLAREELGWRAEVGPAEAIEQVARGWRTSGTADA